MKEYSRKELLRIFIFVIGIISYFKFMIIELNSENFYTQFGWLTIFLISTFISWYLMNINLKKNY